MLPTSMPLVPFALPQLQRPYDIGLDRPAGNSGPCTLPAGFFEEADSAETAPDRPAMGYRLRDRKLPIAIPRPFGPHGGA